jgi:hypothetical protein
LRPRKCGAIYAHLVEVQRRRNEFVHGNAEAIDDSLAYVTIEKLQEVQEAWVALYNKRCTGNANAPPVWRGKLAVLSVEVLRRRPRSGVLHPLYSALLDPEVAFGKR